MLCSVLVGTIDSRMVPTVHEKSFELIGSVGVISLRYIGATGREQ